MAAVTAPFSLTDVAPSVGLDLRQGAFRFGVTGDQSAMMGGGLCWLDYDGDGWLDLYVVNSYADSDIGRYAAAGGLPRSRLFHNVDGRFVDVTGKTRTGLEVRGSGCAAADLDGNGTTDLVVTTAGYDAARDAYDAVLWNNGDGTFTEGAKAAGIDQPGWHTGGGGRGRQRRRPARPRRRGLHRRQPPGARVDIGLPREPRRGARPSVPQRRRARRAPAIPRGGTRGRARATRARPWARRDLHRRERRRPTRPVRGERPRPQPALPQPAREERARLPARRERQGAGARRLERRAWESPQATSPATGARTCS